MSRTDIYNYKRQMEILEKYLEKHGICARNKEIIGKFKEYCLMQGLSSPRIIRYYNAFRYFDEFLGKPFDKVCKRDVGGAVAKINARESWSPVTKHDMKVMLKRFYKWLYGNDEDYPDEVRWIKTRVKRTDRKLPSDGDLLTEEDIAKAIEHSLHSRDKALISTLYEAGCRIGELCSLRIKDVTIDRMDTETALLATYAPKNKYWAISFGPKVISYNSFDDRIADKHAIMLEFGGYIH